MSRPRDLDGLPGRVAAIRTRLGLSQGDFAGKIGVSRNAVTRYEGGLVRPRANRLERIAQLGGVSVDWLLRGDRRPPGREWDDAVRLLRAVWRQPGRRELVRRAFEGAGAIEQAARPEPCVERGHSATGGIAPARGDLPIHWTW